jgi:hypothetical protein
VTYDHFIDRLEKAPKQNPHSNTKNQNRFAHLRDTSSFAQYRHIPTQTKNIPTIANTKSTANGTRIQSGPWLYPSTACGNANSHENSATQTPKSSAHNFDESRSSR